MSGQQAYSEMIKRGNILAIAHKLGMDGNLFTDPGMAEFYSNHEWIVINNNEVGEVINAIPTISRADSIPWEEWFIVDCQIRHHVLFTSKHQKSNMTWEGHPGDKDHPKQVLGMLWHVYNDDNLTPFLNR